MASTEQSNSRWPRPTGPVRLEATIRPRAGPARPLAPLGALRRQRIRARSGHGLGPRNGRREWGGAGQPQQRAARSTEALNQPIGHLLSTDGLRIPLDRAYVVGREPEADPAVKSGAATPVRLSDDENLISRVHSYIAVEEGRVSLRDASSANGTYMAAPGDEAWTRVGDDPVELPPAWSMRVGNQVFTYVAATAAP